MKVSCSLLLLHALYRAAWACAAEAEGTSSDTLVLCRACGHQLASGSDMGSVPSRLALSASNHTLPGGRSVHVQVFQNPHGRRFHVVVFKKADVVTRGPADERFSWFPGFSWTVVTCPQCSTHLGWAFQPTSWPQTTSESEQTFLALIVHRLLREDFASSLLVTPKSFTG
ncbi:protein cereblon [Entelurus aequoreus]|uniref:protein cereblon n=1 Tax=Entelurus aequoreus TaxID=161455 RepID=UPI002B1D6D79|nr:protein cereblon [Entelurus aequoreus]